jgi:threonine synthase
MLTLMRVYSSDGIVFSVHFPAMRVRSETLKLIFVRFTMNTDSCFTHLECSSCGLELQHDTPRTFCATCNRPLLARYDLRKARGSLNRDSLRGRESSLWRYRELLPVFDDARILTLGEGWTPIIPAPALASEMNLASLLIKDESFNPTGSFKARGLCVAVSRAKELGLHELCLPSAGNAGGALAAYAARGGMRAFVFVPSDTPEINIREVGCFGGHLELVDGVISDAGKRMSVARTGTGWFDLSTMKEPYRLEGKKTMGYELAEQLGWRLPDVIVYPTGGGTGLIGMWKAFQEMEELGWIGPERPRMVAVQSSGCAPIVRAFGERKPVSNFWDNATTIASGLRVPKAFADELILMALYESGGVAVAVEDGSLLDEMKRSARVEGMLLCPEGAACIAAVRKLAGAGTITSGEKVLVFNTGSGYKYLEAIRRMEG